MKSQGKREYRPFIPKRSVEEVGRIQEVIVEVAGLARPRVTAVEMITGNPRADKWHIARLRMVVACRLYDLGFRPGEIAKLFRQDHSTTTNQLRGVHRLREMERYAMFFTPNELLNPAVPRVVLKVRQPRTEGSCSQCGKVHDRDRRLCFECTVKMREYCRKSYRRKHGIAEDAPLITSGRPKIPTPVARG